MKQSLGLHLLLVSTLTTLFICQVQGGIITNQETLSLPKELADSIAVASTNTATDSKNGTRIGRVMYTASYSNVRISSKEPKSLKYFPIPAVISKKHVPSPTVIVPVLKTSTTAAITTTTSEPTTTTTTQEPTTVSTTTTTTTTTTSEPPPPPEAVQVSIPDIIEILEEIEPGSNEDEEVVTETVSGGGDPLDNENLAVTEQNVEEE